MDSKYMFKLKIPSFALLFSLFLICTNLMVEGLTSIASDGATTKIGAILDLDSRMGKEQKIAMDIVIEQKNARFSLHLIDYNQSRPLQTAFKVEELIKEKKVEVIIVGIDNWQTTALVAKMGALAQVPILSLAASPPITSQFASLQWPFLVQMSHNTNERVQNLASIIHAFLWRRVIVVYEDDVSTNCGNCGIISLLTTALQNIGAQIEHQLVLPPLGSTTNPRVAMTNELSKLVNEGYYSRVFIVLRISSLPYVSLLFEEAKGVGLMRNDSAWILLETIANFLPSFDNSTLSSMEGVIGIMTKFDNTTKDFEIFEAKFGINFLKAYEKEWYYEPSFQALVAYDAITTIFNAKQRLSRKNGEDIATSNSFLAEILQINFTGLSGKIIFDQNQHDLEGNTSTKLVNIASSNYGEVLDFSSEDIEDEDTGKTLASLVKWPGNSTSAMKPKGWAMPTNTKLMRIGVPIAHHYGNYINYIGSRDVDVDFCFKRNITNSDDDNKNYGGYSVALFKEVLKQLDYKLPYVFIPYNGSFDDLIKHVQNKCFDAAIGDITILGRRMELVDFTLPYEDSGLSIILPAFEYAHDPWIFLKPFTSKMWILMTFVFVYNMIIIWALERGSNSEFRGTWRNQLSATAWFTINSIYFSQREKISSKLARVVMIMWLFIILILTSSYTANLTSMITNDRLNQTSIDVERLQRTNAKVGYDRTSFVNTFLEDLLRFDSKNLIPVGVKFEDIHMELQSSNITVACLEYPYARLFVSKYCNKYIMTNPIYRFGGFGFVFPKGSPITFDVSKAILNLTENGQLNKLKDKYLNLSSECISNADDSDNNNNDGQQSSLSLESFEVLFYLSGASTTACLLASLIPLSRNFLRRMAT